MRKLLIAAIGILLAAGVNAQPQLLSCTETAFNFNFNLGTKWKVTLPKMGPAEILRNAYDYIPGWSLKTNNVNPAPQPSPLFNLPPGALGYTVGPQNYAPLFYSKNFGLTNNPGRLLPVIDLMPSANYSLLKTGLPANSLQP